MDVYFRFVSFPFFLLFYLLGACQADPKEGMDTTLIQVNVGQSDSILLDKHIHPFDSLRGDEYNSDPLTTEDLKRLIDSMEFVYKAHPKNKMLRIEINDYKTCLNQMEKMLQYTEERDSLIQDIINR